MWDESTQAGINFASLIPYGFNLYNENRRGEEKGRGEIGYQKTYIRFSRYVIQYSIGNGGSLLLVFLLLVLTILSFCLANLISF